MKKKILIILNSEPLYGGLYQYSIMLADALVSSNRFDITINTSNFEIYKKYKDKVKVKFKKKFLKKIKEFFFEFRFIKKGIYRFILYLKPFLKKFFNIFGKNISEEIDNQFDIIVYPSQNFIYQKPDSKTKIISVIHDLMHIYEGHFKEYSPEEKLMRDYLFSNICKNSDIIVSDSNVGKTHISEMYNCELSKIRPIYFCPYNHYENLESFILFKKKFSNFSFKNYFFYPAQFWEHKNHLRILDSIYYLKLKGLEVNIILSGSRKNNFDKVIKKIKYYNIENNVLLAGYVDENIIKYLYKNAIALVYPSLIGPTNIPPLEAMQYDCPVICSDIYGMREQLKDAAYFINPQSVKELSQAMQDLIINQDLRNNLIKRGKNLVKLRSYERFKEDYLKLISSL